MANTNYASINKNTLTRSDSPTPRTEQHYSSNACPFETTFVNRERRFPMFSGDRRSPPRSEYRHIHTLKTKEDAAITTQVETLYKQLLPLPEDLQKKQDLVKKLETLLNKEWPGKEFTVHAFGSTENMLATRDSDLDVCIETEWTGFEHRICELSSFMARSGMQNVVCRAQAKVPVVAIYDPELKIACDMNINNTLALRNTRLVRTYMQLDERARQLTFAIKHWAANRALNEAVCNTLTSYTWTLMVINYLQTRRVAPVLPSLQEWPHEPVPRINGLDVSFADDIEKYDTLQTFSMQNCESVGTLLFGFFHHYAYEFNYHRDVASVRLGSIITRHEKGFSNESMICIEEPFTVSRNLGNTADVGSHRGIHQELQRAHLMLAEGESLSTVFAKYEPSKEPVQKPESRKWKPSPSPLKSRPTRASPARLQNQQCQQLQQNRTRSRAIPVTSDGSITNFVHTGSPRLRNVAQGAGMGSAVNLVQPGRERVRVRAPVPETDAWQAPTIADYQFLMSGSDPRQFPSQLLHYANLYHGRGAIVPENMQRARSQPPSSSDCRNVQQVRRNSLATSNLKEAERSRLRQQGKRHFHGHLTEDHLAIALGLPGIEMIASNHETEVAQNSQASSLNKAVLEAYEASFSKSHHGTSCFSDGGDSHTSLGLTHASSQSSPSSISAYPSPLQPTYAQVSSGHIDGGLRSPPHLSLNSVTDETGTVSSHFSVLSSPVLELTPKQKEKVSGFTTPVTYASKVCSTPSPSSSPTAQSSKSSRPYEPFITVQARPRVRSTKQPATK